MAEQRLVDAIFLEKVIEEYKLCQCKSKYTTEKECLAARHGMDLAKMVLHNVPTVEAKPVVHARNLSADTPSQFECSVCGCEDWDTYTCDVDVYKYCPNCGAQMDEEVAENG